jgi:APA family basic amino acid/polyamine antiporter
LQEPDNAYSMTIPSGSELRRVLRLPHATAMVVGTIIGASIFVQPSEITGQVPSIGGVFLVWLISGALTLIGALVCAELASIFTRTGGVYIYLKEAYTPSMGFMWGWAMFWSMHSGIIAAIAVVFSRYVAFFLPMNDTGTKTTAIAAILILSWINCIGVKQGSTLQTLFTLGKLLAIGLIVLLGLVLGSRLPEHFVTPDSFGANTSTSDFLNALVAGLFAFGGWHMVTYSSEETVNPRHTIPRALILGTLIVTACYIAMNTVYMYILPLDAVASSTRIAADAADFVLGFGGGATMSAIVMFSTFGALSGIVLAGPRVYFSMARDGLLFRWLGEIHPRYRTPHRAIMVQAAWSSILVGTGTFRVLFTRVVYTEWVFFALMTAGLFILRRRSDLRRDYSVWGYPVLPIVFIISCFAIVANQLLSNTREAVFGLTLVLTGIPVYYMWARNGLAPENRT